MEDDSNFKRGLRRIDLNKFYNTIVNFAMIWSNFANCEYHPFIIIISYDFYLIIIGINFSSVQ